MRGQLSQHKWNVHQMYKDDYYAERIIRGKHEQIYLRSHCLWCAKSDVLAKHGGEVDLRGWHMALCGSYTKAMQAEIIKEKAEWKNPDDSNDQ